MISLSNIKVTKLLFFILSLGFWIFLAAPGLIIISLAFLFLILFEKYLSIKIPSVIAIIFVGFIIFTLVLGSYWNFYEKFLWWDDALHAFYGWAFAFIWFLSIQYVSKLRGITQDIFIICAFSFCFSVAWGALWEIYEFLYDSLFDGNMQRTHIGRGVTDTMYDIIVETSAAFAVNLGIYWYVKYGKSNWIKTISEAFFDLNKDKFEDQFLQDSSPSSK